MADRVLLVLDDPCRLDGAATGTTVGAAVSTTGGRAREVAPDRPVVSATDLGVTRGDGIFEVLGVRADASGGVQVHAERDVAEVKRTVPAGQWCPGHDKEKAPATGGFFARLFGR